MYNRPPPIERKVQLTGGSSYTVSIPKEWAIDQDIDSETTVECFVREEALVITNPQEGDLQERVVEIGAHDRVPGELVQAIVGAYVAGASKIVCTDMGDREDRQRIRETVNGLVGLEIQEETPSHIIAQTMLDVGALSPEQTIRQMRMTALEMHHGAIEALRAGDHEAANLVRRRDDEVDRLFGVIAREFHRTLDEPVLPTGQYGVTAFDYYTVGRQIERIADHAVKIAITVQGMSEQPADEITEDLVAVGDDVRTIIDDAIAAFLQSEEAGAFLRIPRELASLQEQANELERRMYDEEPPEIADSTNTVLDSIRRCGEYGVNVAEAGLIVKMRTGSSPETEALPP